MKPVKNDLDELEQEIAGAAAALRALKARRKSWLARAQMKAMVADPAFQAKATKAREAAMKEKWADPEYRRRMALISSERMKRRWKSPEYRAHHAAKLAEARGKRKPVQPAERKPRPVKPVPVRPVVVPAKRVDPYGEALARTGKRFNEACR